MKHLSHSILLLICLTVLFQTGYACTCMPEKIEDELVKTEYLFVGEVIKITEEDFSEKQTNKIKKFFITFKIRENFKGAEEQEITLIQYKYKKDISCNSFVNFKKKEKYLISANITEEKEIKVNNFCLRTQKFNKKSDKYKKLTELKKSKPELF